MTQSRAVVAALGVLAMIGSAGMLVGTTRTPAAAAGPPVYVYGDSVLLGARTAIEQRLAGENWEPHVRAWVGMNMPNAIELVASERSRFGDVVVLGVGNNYFGNPDVFRREIDAMMNELRGVSRVIWLTLREFTPDRADANRELVLGIERWPNLEIADWNTLSVSQPNTFWNDGLHLRPEGAQLMASLIADRLSAFRSGAPRATVPVIGAGGPLVRPQVYGFGGAPPPPSPDVERHSPFVGLAANGSDTGWWLTTALGQVSAGGDAELLGDLDGIALNQPIVDIESTPSGRGYWLVASDGGVFSFGDAKFWGSTGSIALNQPIVGAEATPSGEGYWLVASDGGVFSFGDAKFWGSTGAITLNQPIVGMATGPSGAGYWLVASDGGVFSFGSSVFMGSRGGTQSEWPVVDLLANRNGSGYLMLDEGGGVHAFGSAVSLGSPARADDERFFAIERRPGGYWLASQRPA